jgi:GNAT superfamily N-acetyltransferase
MRAIATREYALKSGVTLHYRSFQPSDAGACAALLERGIRGSNNTPDLLKNPFNMQLYTREMVAYNPDDICTTAQKRNYRVALVADRLVGVIGIERVSASEAAINIEKTGLYPNYVAEHTPRAAEVLDLVVAEGWRCKNIGRLLLLAGLIEAFEQGIVHFYAYGPANTTSLMTPAGFESHGPELDSIRWGKVRAFHAELNPDKVNDLKKYFQLIQAAGAQISNIAAFVPHW